MCSAPKIPPAAGIEDAVATSFLRRLIEDESSGDERPLDEYLLLYPGFEPVIAREYEAAVGGERPDGIRSGSRIDHYELIEKLGEGGFGQVWLASDLELGRRVALKILGRGVGTDRDLARLEREAAIASRIDHDGLCTVHAARVDGAVPYIAMQYVEGSPLSKVLAGARDRGLPCADVGAGGIEALLGMVARIARALHAAHEAGVVHRDVKPANVMIRTSGEPVVLDFGLARELLVEPLSLSWELRGTIGYMAPEQLEPGKAVDRRTDVHALGIVLHECLALERPFRGRTIEEVALAIREEPPPDLRRFTRIATKDICAVVERCLEKDPDRRYATAHELALDLDRLIAKEPVRARPPSRARRLVTRVRRRPAAAALVVVSAVILFGAGASAAWFERQVARLARADASERAEKLERRLESGFLALASYEPERARTIFEDAAEIDAESVEAAAGRALALIDLGRAAEAAELVRPRVQRHPELRSVLTGAESRVRDGTPPTDPEDSAASSLGWFLIGQMWLLNAGHGDDTTAAFRGLEAMERACLTATRARAIFHFGRARAAGVARDLAAARASAEALCSLWPDSAAAAFFAGFSLHGVGDIENAIEHLGRAVKLDDGFTFARIGLGGALIDAGRPREGLEQYAVVLAANPDDATACFNSGLACEQLGDLEQAADFYRRGLQADPGFTAFRMNLVEVLHRLGDDAGIGQELGNWARHHKDDADAWMRWARHEHAHLDDDESVTRLEVAARHALELANSAEAALLLATALVEGDREEDALAVARHALATGASGVHAAELRRLVDELR